jgi:hypothetical protein
LNDRKNRELFLRVSANVGQKEGLEFA